MYVKGGADNPKYLGKRLTDLCLEQSDILKEHYGKTFVFDGDTIEFITVSFYNKKLTDVLTELDSSKKTVIDNINKIFDVNNIFKQFGKVQIMKKNHPFATHFTNINNYGMFNNGTIHVNITLPTLLNKIGLIENTENFVITHRNYIKYIQLVEPILISVFGSPDIFSQSNVSLKDQFSAGSQRCSVSRYIGLGTYDVDEMMTGKVLTKKLTDIAFSQNEYWWYNKFHQNSAYKKLDQIGLDINFNKHYNHGIEIRFFDHLNSDQLENAIVFLVYLADFILDKNNNLYLNKSINPGNDKTWNLFTEDVIRYGSNANVNNEILNLYENAFGKSFNSSNTQALYDDILTFLKEKYQSCGLSLIHI